MKFFLKNGLCSFLLITASILMTTTCTYGKDFTDGPRARTVLADQVRQMFQDGKFAELDSMAEKYRVTKSRFPDGQWKLLVFYTAFDVSSNTPEWVFPKFISLAEKWRRLHPSSVTAQCVLASVWTDYAWKERGSGYASEVKDEAWPLVQERLDKAWKIINEPPAQGVPDCPRRHNLRLILARARGVDEKEFEVLFSKAIKQAPGYYQHYVAKADYLLPKWHGHEGDWQRFVTKVANQNSNGEGLTIYTRTAWGMFLGDDWKDFHGSGISWDKMQAGFKEIEHNYPNSPWVLNWYARFACRSGDLKTMKVLFKRINSRNYYPEAWGRDNIEDCRYWVRLGKSKEEVGREKMAEHMKQFEERVFKDLLALAEKGNRQVIGDLAEMYLNGRGTTSDPIAAYAWLLQDEATYKDQLAKNVKSLTVDQLRQARKKSVVIRNRISQHAK